MSLSSSFMASDADAYEQQMGRWSRRLAEPFLDFVGTRDGESVLDVGCGTGSLSFALKARCKSSIVRAVDFSPVRVAHAVQRNRDPGLTFEVGDACGLRFADASFDRVLAQLVLHFVPQPERAVAEMRRVARPGATVAAAVWDVRGGYVTNRMFFDTAAMLDPAGEARRSRSYTRPMTRPGELAGAWQAAGLSEVVDSSLTIRMEFTDFEDYWQPFVGKAGPGADHMQALPADNRSALRDAVRRAYLDGEPDGPRSYAATAWAVKGRAPA